MKLRSLAATCTLSLAFTASLAFAHEQHKGDAAKPAATAPATGKLVKLTDKDAAWAAKARAAYPLKTCLTSDEKLGSMGDNAEFIYREAGKPDRLVIFCCGGCGDDFAKEPAKYLAVLDAAAKKKSGK